MALRCVLQALQRDANRVRHEWRLEEGVGTHGNGLRCRFRPAQYTFWVWAETFTSQPHRFAMGRGGGVSSRHSGLSMAYNNGPHSGSITLLALSDKWFWKRMLNFQSRMQSMWPNASLLFAKYWFHFCGNLVFKAFLSFFFNPFLQRFQLGRLYLANTIRYKQKLHPN